MTIHRMVRVERNRLRFAAAHMATFGGDCEPLHGHNYDVLVEVEGDLTEESWVIDFSLLKRLASAICGELDHQFLLQAESRILHSERKDGFWELRFGDQRRYRFPESDVLALPIDNSTVERLSEWFHGRLSRDLLAAGAHNIERLRIGIEEMPGQTAWFIGPVANANITTREQTGP